mmetsp:Transcript_45464/g.75491  ORF Transcript_45464/g.75491 Transcript_45464/m.75491 type:complete len:236 (-) Transcript_45464:460-1167(-)
MCRFQQNLHRLLKRRPHNRSSLASIDTMACNRHQVPLTRHGIHQNRQMSKIDIRAIKRDHIAHLIQQRLSRSFNAQNLENMHDMIRRRTSIIHLLHRHHIQQRRSLRIQHPLFIRFRRPITRHSVPRALIFLAHKHLLNAANTAQLHLVQQFILQPPQEVILAIHIILLLLAILATTAAQLIATLHQSNLQHQVLRVIVTKETLQIILPNLVNFIRNKMILNRLVLFLVPVQLDT